MITTDARNIGLNSNDSRPADDHFIGRLIAGFSA